MKTTVALAVLIVALMDAAACGAQSPAPVLAATPPMGWNSWNKFAKNIDDATIRAQTDALVSSGMKAAGYEYIVIDDGWEGERDSEGNLHPNKNFPDMRSLADYVHSKGLKIGIYSSPGPAVCGGADGSGSYGHEEQDAKLFASWGMDFLKYDWCTAGSVYQRSEYPEAIRKMSVALAHTGRPIVYSIHGGGGAVWRYAAAQGANLWRTTSDINATYARIVSIGFAQEGLEKFAGPDHWNDPDMLEVGNGMKNGEDMLHMSLWCLLAAPLIAGNDLAAMKPATQAVLTNPEVIAVDQDPAAVQGHIVRQEGAIAIMMKPLKDGSKAVGLFNREGGLLTITVNFSELGLQKDASVRDLWKRQDLGVFHDSFSVDVPPRSVVLVKISSAH